MDVLQQRMEDRLKGLDKRLFTKYLVFKRELLNKEYCFTHENFPGANDHGPAHIKRVITYLSLILADELLESMTSYELFYS